MNIKVGMVVKFKTLMNAASKLGEVIEVVSIKDHTDKNLIGTEYYIVDELDGKIVNTKITNVNIEEIYEKVSTWGE